MKLSFTRIEKLKPKDKLYRINDGKGLCIEVRPAGSKLWRFRYQKPDGKYSMISLGPFPEIGLAEAREMAAEKRKRLAHNMPVVNQGTDFNSVFREWHEKNKHSWTTNHALQIYKRIEANILPWIGKRHVGEISGPELLTAIRRIENRGHLETAHRVLQVCDKIFQYAVASGLAERNPAKDIKGALPPRRKRNWQAPTDPREVAALLRCIEEYQGSFVTKCGLKFLALTFVRPGELRRAKWSNVDFEKQVWRIPSEDTKMKREHLVPLSRQALGILKEIYPLTGHSIYIFPSERSSQRAMSENTLNGALRRMGYTKEEIVSHGFRHMASTLLHEQNYPSHIIERQLAHTDNNKVRGTYNKAQYIDERTKIMQEYADYLEGLITDAYSRKLCGNDPKGDPQWT